MPRACEFDRSGFRSWRQTARRWKADAGMDVAEALNNVATPTSDLAIRKQAVVNYNASDKMFEPAAAAAKLHEVRRMRFEIQVRLACPVEIGNLEQAKKHYLNALADRETLLTNNGFERRRTPQDGRGPRHVPQTST